VVTASRPSIRQRIAQWAGGILFVLLVVAPIIGWLSQPNYEAVAEDVRTQLEPATTLSDFTRVSEKSGLWCLDYADSGHTVAFCRKDLSSRIYSWVSWLEWHPKGVTAYGEFVDGRKSAEYDVRIQTLGP
jgi:hypothetical protein